MTDHCCAHPKCPGGSLCCCQGQPDPIERAGNALMRNRAYQAGVAFGVPDETEAEAKHRSEIIKAVMESIDTGQLWETIQYAQQNGDDPALAVKNWLTGNN